MTDEKKITEITLCELSGVREHSGYCPLHMGDACLAVYVPAAALRERDRRIAELTQERYAYAAAGLTIARTVYRACERAEGFPPGGSDWSVKISAIVSNVLEDATKPVIETLATVSRPEPRTEP